MGILALEKRVGHPKHQTPAKYLHNRDKHLYIIDEMEVDP